MWVKCVQQLATSLWPTGTRVLYGIGIEQCYLPLGRGDILAFTLASERWHSLSPFPLFSIHDDACDIDILCNQMHNVDIVVKMEHNCLLGEFECTYILYVMNVRVLNVFFNFWFECSDYSVVQKTPDPCFIFKKFQILVCIIDDCLLYARRDRTQIYCCSCYFKCFKNHSK